MEHNRRLFLKSSVAAGALLGLDWKSAFAAPGPHTYKRDGKADYVKTYDILVAGAGIAGVAAAVAAARAGAKVGLLEKTIQPGGLSTIGLANWFTPLDNGKGKQVTFGLAEEFMIASQKYGDVRINKEWQKKSERYDAEFNSIAFIYTLDELLDEAGVEVHYDMLVCDPVIDNGVITGVEVENTMGRGIIEAKCIIDATGTGEVAYRAGVPCLEAENEAKFSYIKVMGSHKRAEIERSVKIEAIPKELLLNKKYKGTHQDVSRFAIDTRQALAKHYLTTLKEGNFARNKTVGMIPVMPQMDKIRSVRGVESLKFSAVNKNIDSSVGLVADWQDKGKVWSIPYGCILPEKVKGLVTAGRCISVDDDAAWDIIKVTHARAHTGQIAGLAAAIAVKLKTTPDAIDVKTVQSELSKNGVKYQL